MFRYCISILFVFALISCGGSSPQSNLVPKKDLNEASKEIYSKDEAVALAAYKVLSQSERGGINFSLSVAKDRSVVSSVRRLAYGSMMKSESISLSSNQLSDLIFQNTLWASALISRDDRKPDTHEALQARIEADELFLEFSQSSLDFLTRQIVKDSRVDGYLLQQALADYDEGSRQMIEGEAILKRILQSLPPSYTERMAQSLLAGRESLQKRDESKSLLNNYSGDSTEPASRADLEVLATLAGIAPQTQTSKKIMALFTQDLSWLSHWSLAKKFAADAGALGIFAAVYTYSSESAEWSLKNVHEILNSKQELSPVNLALMAMVKGADRAPDSLEAFESRVPQLISSILSIEADRWNKMVGEISLFVFDADSFDDRRWDRERSRLMGRVFQSSIRESSTANGFGADMFIAEKNSVERVHLTFTDRNSVELSDAMVVLSIQLWTYAADNSEIYKMIQESPKRNPRSGMPNLFLDDEIDETVALAIQNGNPVVVDAGLDYFSKHKDRALRFREALNSAARDSRLPGSIRESANRILGGLHSKP